jgi:hypothetical protein
VVGVDGPARTPIFEVAFDPRNPAYTPARNPSVYKDRNGHSKIETIDYRKE